MGIGSIQGIGEPCRRGALAITVLAVVGISCASAVVVPATAVAGYYDVYMCADGYGAGAFQNGWSSNAGTNLDTAANCSHPREGRRGRRVARACRSGAQRRPTGHRRARTGSMLPPERRSSASSSRAASMRMAAGLRAGRLLAVAAAIPSATAAPPKHVWTTTLETRRGRWMTRARSGSGCGATRAPARRTPLTRCSARPAAPTSSTRRSRSMSRARPRCGSLRIPTVWISNKNGPLAGWTDKRVSEQSAGSAT